MQQSLVEKPFVIPIVVSLVGVVLLIGAFILAGGIPSPSSGVEILDVAAEEDIDTKKPATGEIIVEVAGAVKSPGVFALPSNARITDALEKAGGITNKADSERISQTINRAAKLTDGQKIYIPEKGEATTLSTPATSVGSLISINTATAEELDTLPGIGPATAQKIIEGRPYASLDELLSKKAVGSKVFSDIKEKVGL